MVLCSLSIRLITSGPQDLLIINVRSSNMKRPLAEATPSSSGLPRVTLVMDNGADRLRVGFAGEPEPRMVIPNCTAKLKGQLQVGEGMYLTLPYL